MKQVIVFLALTMVVASGSAMAAGHAENGHDGKCLKECQMLVRNCDQEVDSLPQRITKLKSEIGKGSSAYSAEELRTLHRKLKEAEDLLTNLNYGG